MGPLRLAAIFALMTACYRQESPAYETFPEPITVAGPPSGEIDRAWTADPYAADPNATPDGYGGGYTAPSPEPSSDPNDAGYVMGSVTDAEIDVTLSAYGEWIDNGEYGRVWRPYTTAVGVDFTPYESCGSWVWTDWGWTFACDWDWGWLAFHYGRWGFYDDYWAWQPDYEWSPGWVEWRGGGGYVGWRPLAPIVRDHRTANKGPTVRDHRTGAGPNIRDHRTHRTMDSHWRFTANKDFGKRIRPNLYKVPAEGLRVTSTVTRPPVRPNYQPVHVASIMRGRLALRDSIGIRNPRTPQAAPATDTGGGRNAPWGGRVGGRVGGRIGAGAPGRSFDPPSGSGSPAVYAPTYPTYQPPRPQRGTHGSAPAGFDPPDRVATPPEHTRPSFDDHPIRPTRPSIDPGSSPPPRTRPSFGDRPSAPPVDRAPSPPPRTRPSFGDRPSAPPIDRAPARPTWTPPPHAPPPSRGSSSSGSSGNWSPPSRSSSSSSSSSGGNWSPPSRSPSSSSSSSPGSSRSSGSSHSSGSSRSSGGGWGGGGGGGGTRNHRR